VKDSANENEYEESWGKANEDGGMEGFEVNDPRTSFTI
jgi:hypothetical protein